jgi:drug/metabolite transporter (DMT)-like permease
VIAIALALAASVSWGVGDFFGGVASRRLSALAVLAISQPVGLVVILAVALAAGDPSMTTVGILAGLAAGIGGAVGLGGLFGGMTVGAMGVVAPISASAAAIPVVVGVVRGERPSGLQLTGIAVALLGVALASREPGGGEGRLAAGVPFALLAVAGFGAYFVFIDRASADDALWGVVVARSCSSVVSLAVAGARGSLRVPRRAVPLIALVGFFDVAANALVAFALTKGYVSVVSVLASLYPLITIALAIAVLRERPSRIQALGGVGALAGVALISAG